MPTALEVDSVSLEYGAGDQAVSALEDISLTVPAHEILAIVGPSGCGKSTLLNIIAGFVRPNHGTVHLGAAALRGVSREVTYLTQRDTLLPWRRVIDNAAISLEIQGMPRRERRPVALEHLRRVGLEGFDHHFPHQLSGGMRSRLALARALIAERPILLMDEPFGALDALLRMQMQQLLMDLWTESPRTIVYVTHDVTEAVALSHRVLVMTQRPGRLKHEETIDLAHPRDVIALRGEPIYNEACEKLWRIVTEELDD